MRTGTGTSASPRPPHAEASETSPRLHSPPRSPTSAASEAGGSSTAALSDAGGSAGVGGGGGGKHMLTLNHHRLEARLSAERREKEQALALRT